MPPSRAPTARSRLVTIEVELDEARGLERGRAGCGKPRPELTPGLLMLLRHAVRRVTRARAPKERRRVERPPRGHREAIAAASSSTRPTASSKLRRPSAARWRRTSSATMEQVRLDVLRRGGEFGAQLRPLRRDPDRTGVEVARAHHQAALGKQQRGAERDLVRAEERRDDDVPAGLQPPVDAQPDAAPQPFRDEGLLRLGEAELPRHARVLDRGERAGAGAAVAAGDVHDVGQRLDHAGGDEPDAGLGDELHRDAAAGLTCLRSKTSCARSSIE